jgi:hypothetical protein
MTRGFTSSEAAIELLMRTLLGKEDGEVLVLGKIHILRRKLDRAEVALPRALSLAPALAQHRDSGAGKAPAK